MKQALLAILVLAAACDGDTTAADRMRAEFATQPVTIDDLSISVSLALRSDVIYVAGAYRLVQIDRATGAVLELFSDDQNVQIARLAADDDHVYAVFQHGGGPADVVRIAKGGGAPELVYAGGAESSFEALVVHDGVVYTLVSQRIDSAWRRRILALAPDGGEPRVVTDDPPLTALTGFVAAADGLFFGVVSSTGEVWHVPYAGGSPENVQTLADRYAMYLAADATGVYWNAGDSAMLATGPATLYFLPNGATTPEVLADDVTRGEFSVNGLGFYWGDYEGQAIRAVARDDVGGGAFDLIDTGVAPGRLVADDHVIVYETFDQETGTSAAHVVPRVQ